MHYVTPDYQPLLPAGDIARCRVSYAEMPLDDIIGAAIILRVTPHTPLAAAIITPIRYDTLAPLRAITLVTPLAIRRRLR